MNHTNTTNMARLFHTISASLYEAHALRQAITTILHGEPATPHVLQLHDVGPRGTGKRPPVLIA